MPSLIAAAYNLYFRLKKRPETPDYEAARRADAERGVPKLPRGVALKVYPWGETLTKPGNDKGWIFYIHGGGFTTGSARERRFITQLLADRYRYQVAGINYRLAPENKWPAQIEDCLAAWRSFTDLGAAPGETVLMGESAGGTLALSLALLLKQEGMPMPKAVVAFSPCVNQAEHYPSHSLNAKTDYMLRDAVAKGLSEPIFGDRAAPELLRDPIVSPVYGDYTGMPPIFLSASDAEALLDDSRVLYEKLRAEGHRAELDIQHGVCHAFQMFPPIPEGRVTRRKVFAFLESC